MGFKITLLCASVLLVQSISGTCIRRISLPSYGSGSSLSSTSGSVINNGGSFIVTSISPIIPTGIAVASDLGLAGDLDVKGCLPFLAGVEFGASMPTSGSGSVNYGCGSSSQVGITSVTGGSGGGRLNSCGCGL